MHDFSDYPYLRYLLREQKGQELQSFAEFKGLSAVIRETVIRIAEVAGSQENKGEKMEILYDYLISHEFKAQIEAIVDGFTRMKED